MDFTDLNKACPKDCYPLPRIDLPVDATVGHSLLSFMDAYFGYNQIRMFPGDEGKTSFIIDGGTYCYKVMTFGLKNAGATYQRLVNHMFRDLIGKSMEVYVDDLLVKSKEDAFHLPHLAEAFHVLRKFQMKLRVQGVIQKVPRAHDQQEGNQGQPREDSGHYQHAVPKDDQRSLKSRPSGGSPESIRFPGY